MGVPPSSSSSSYAGCSNSAEWAEVLRQSIVGDIFMGDEGRIRVAVSVSTGEFDCEVGLVLERCTRVDFVNLHRQNNSSNTIVTATHEF